MARTHPHNPLVAVRSHRWCISRAARLAADADIRRDNDQGYCVPSMPMLPCAASAKLVADNIDPGFGGRK